MTAKPFIVISGLPASGKTSLALKLAAELKLPLLDKDDILEGLFECEPVVDLAARQRLSRTSDQMFAKLAATSPGAVLVSFWRHDGDEGQSGTPTDWVKALAGIVVEVHCVCDPQIAERRFRERKRHPGHNDTARSSMLSAQLRALSERGPLGLGPTIFVRTDEPYDVASVVEEVRRHIN